MSDSYSITIYVSLSEIQISVTDTGVTDFTVNNGVIEYTNSVSASTTDFSIIDFIHPTCFSVGVLNVQYQPVILFENITANINDYGDLPSWSACCLAPMTTYNPSETQSSFQFNYGYGNPLFYNGPYVQFLIIVGVSPSGCRFSSPVPQPDSLCTTIVSGSSCPIDYPIQVDISVQYDVPNFMTAFGIGLLGSPFSDSVVTYSLTLTNLQEEDSESVVDPNSPSNGCYWAMYPQIDDNNNGTNAWNDIIPLNSEESSYSLDCSNIMTWENIVNESPTMCCGQYVYNGWTVYQFMPFSSSSPLSYTQGGVNASTYTCCCSNQNTADGCLGTTVDGADVLCNANCSTEWLYCGDSGDVNCPGVID